MKGSACELVIGRLESSGFRAEADELRALLLELETTDKSKRLVAVRAIEERCHPKWLGDLNVGGSDPWQWLNDLGALRKFARAQIT